MTGSALADAKSIELIEICNETSYKLYPPPSLQIYNEKHIHTNNRSKQEQKEKLAQEELALRSTIIKSPNSRRAKLELAKFLFHQNAFQDAKEIALEVLKLDDSNANAYCLLGRIHGFGQPSDITSSETYFKLALKSDIEYAKAHYFYAYLLRSRLHNYPSAELHYKQAMSLRPDDVTSYNDCAIMLVRQNRFTEAKQLYEKVLELQKDHSIAHFNLANLLRKDLKNYNQAEEHFLIAIENRPKFIAAINNYATMLHHQLKRFSDAEYYYLLALKIDNQYSRAHFNYANLCREHLKKFGIAEEHYIQAINNDGRNPNFYNNYGLLLQYAIKNYGIAKFQYEIALKLDDNHALGHCNYGTILMQMVDKKYNQYYNEGEDRFENVENVNEYGMIGECAGEDMNETYDVYVLKHNFNVDEGKYDDKNEELNVYRIEVYSKNYEKQQRLEYFSKSEFHFQKSIFLNASLVMAYNNYGCLLRRLERFDEAKDMFCMALKIDPHFVMAQRNLNRAEQRELDIKEGRDPNKRQKRRDRQIGGGNRNGVKETRQGSDDEGMSCIVM